MLVNLFFLFLYFDFFFFKQKTAYELLISDLSSDVCSSDLIAVYHRIADRQIRLRAEAGAGLVALFGPSGAGKTSILNMVAGISTPDSGRIAVAGETLFDSGAGIDIPAARRRAGYVFQDGRLFPQMRVRANLLYGRHGDAPLPFDAVMDFLGIGQDRKSTRLNSSH